jgi:hypothetical protein
MMEEESLGEVSEELVGGTAAAEAMDWQMALEGNVLGEEAMHGVQLEEMDLDEIDPDEVDLGEIDPDEVDLDEVDPDEVDLDEIDPDENDLDETDLDEVDLDEMNLVEMNLVDMNLVDMNLDEIDLDEVAWDEVEVNEMGVNEMGAVYNVAEMVPASDEEVLNSVEIPAPKAHRVKNKHHVETAPIRCDVPRSSWACNQIPTDTPVDESETAPAVEDGEAGRH